MDQWFTSFCRASTLSPRRRTGDGRTDERGRDGRAVNGIEGRKKKGDFLPTAIPAAAAAPLGRQEATSLRLATFELTPSAADVSQVW